MKPLEGKFLEEAIDRIARTEDGLLLYLYLQRRMMVITTVDEPGTLQRAEGERTFAARLISLMATGISESGGRTSSSGTGGNTEQPIVFAVPKPVSITGPRGVSRRVDANTRVPGWDPPDLDGGGS